MLSPLSWLTRSAASSKARKVKRQGMSLVEDLETRQLLTTIFSEGFEGSFPADNNWTVNSSQGRTWDDNSLIGGHTGGWAGFGSELNNNVAENPLTYANSMDTTMSKTLDLSNYRDVSLNWYQWLNTEQGFDTLTVTVSRPGKTITSGPFSGNAQSWTAESLDLDSSFDGVSNVTVTFTFHSDGNIQGATAGNKGAWVDDISVTGTTDNGVVPGTIDPALATYYEAFNNFGDFHGSYNIATGTSRQIIAIQAQIDGSYQFNVTGHGGLDPELRVYDSTGEELTNRIDAGGINGGESVTLNLTSGKTYYVGVSGYNDTTGAFNLDITSNTTAFAATVNTPATTYVGQFNDSIGFTGDVDYFTVTAPFNATTLSLTITPSANLDSKTVVYDSNGTVLKTIDNAGAGAVDTGTLNVTANDTYFIAVYGYSLPQTGNYTLKADFNPDLLPPKVESTKAHKNSTGKKVDQLVVKFDQPIDAASAKSIAANYVLVGPKGPITNGFSGASYSQNSWTVVLTLTKPITLKKLGSYKFQILGTGTIHNPSNQFFDGNGDGVAGGDYQLQLSQAPLV